MSDGAEVNLLEEDYIGEVKRDIANALAAAGVYFASATEMENDVYVEGPVSVIWEALQDWRSEVEQLG